MPRPSRTPAFLALLACAASAWSQSVPPLERSGRSDLLAPSTLLLPGFAAIRPGVPASLPPALVKPLLRAGRLDPGWFLVHFRTPITPHDQAWLDALTGAVRREDGSVLARAYVPDDGMLVWVQDQVTWLELARSPRLDRVGRYQPAYKLDPALVDDRLEERASEGTRRLDVELVPGQAPGGVCRELEALGARVLERVHHRGRGLHDLDLFVVEASPAVWTALAWIEGVRTIEEHATRATGPDEFPAALDGRSLRDLVTRARTDGALSGRLTRDGQGPVTALLDLLAWDDPDLAIRALAADGAPSSPLETPLANGLPEGVPEIGHGSAALRKARAILDSCGEFALDLAAPGAPGFDAGRAGGRVLAHDVARAQGFVSPADAPRDYVFHCAGPDAALRVALAWTDEPGGGSRTKRLVDDLDLVLWAPDGSAYRGNRFDAEGASVPGGAPDGELGAECVLIPRPARGTWRATVQPTRGAFSAPQGFALVILGDVLENAGHERLVVPTTLALNVTQGTNSKNGALVGADLARLRTSDDDRLTVRDREDLTLSFDRTVPAGATASALRVLVEHHEEPRVQAGEIVLRLGRGTLASPTWIATSVLPVRSGPGAEALDVWAPAQVPDPNQLVVQVQNTNTNDALLLDRVAIEVDYTPPDPTPHVVSSASPSGVVGVAYQYDADGRAEASGPGPITWSAPGAPAGFSIAATTGLVSWTPAAPGAYALSIRASNASGSDTQTFVVQVTGQAALPSTLLPTNTSVIRYVPAERLALGPAKSQQRLNVFLPPGEAPAHGWPVVLNNRAGGGLATAPVASLKDTGGTAPLHAFVASGVAVVDFGVTGIGGGQGLFYPPGHPSGRYESFLPADDNPEKDAVWALQWLKTQTSYPLDPERICVRGSSEGAIILMWATMGASRAQASGSAAVRADTRVKAVLALQPPTSYWAFDQSPALDSRMIGHLEQAAQPGVAATALSQVAESLQRAASVMAFAFDPAAARANNASQPLCLLYADPVKTVAGAPADLSLDPSGFPRLHDTLGQPFIHDSWSGYVLYKRLIGISPHAAAFHAAHSLFAVRNTSALGPPFAYQTRTYSGNVFGTQASAVAHDWVLESLAVGPRPAIPVLTGAR